MREIVILPYFLDCFRRVMVITPTIKKPTNTTAQIGVDKIHVP